jgi:sialidase-1
LIVPSARSADQYYLTISIGGFEGQTSQMRAYALFSDDHGATWKRGALVKAQTNENQLVELADGAIQMDARQGAGTHRWLMHSRDGGETWSDPVAGQTVTTICASIERYTLAAAGDDRNRLLWTGPKGPGRKHLVIRTSDDEGQTFRNEQTIYGGLAAYSDLTILKDKTVGVIWERGVSEGYQFVTFTRVDRAFLESGK